MKRDAYLQAGLPGYSKSIYFTRSMFEMLEEIKEMRADPRLSDSEIVREGIELVFQEITKRLKA